MILIAEGNDDIFNATCRTVSRLRHTFLATLLPAETDDMEYDDISLHFGHLRTYSSTLICTTLRFIVAALAYSYSAYHMSFMTPPLLFCL